MKASAPPNPSIAETTRPRHRPELGYARGDETRRRIIDAAIRLFGESGYEGASTREIAKLASVNAPALQYYFNGKEGLYKACAEHIAESAAEHFAPAMEIAQAVLARDADREELLAAFDGMQDALADYMLATPDAQNRRLFVTHEQVGHGPNLLMDMFERSVRPQIKEISSTLIARLSGRPNDSLTQIRAATLHGQLMMFHMMARPKLEELIGGPLDAARLARLKGIVRGQTRVLIDSWSAEASGRAAAR